MFVYGKTSCTKEWTRVHCLKTVYNPRTTLTYVYCPSVISYTTLILPSFNHSTPEYILYIHFSSSFFTISRLLIHFFYILFSRPLLHSSYASFKSHLNSRKSLLNLLNSPNTLLPKISILWYTASTLFVHLLYTFYINFLHILYSFYASLIHLLYTPYTPLIHILYSSYTPLIKLI